MSLTNDQKLFQNACKKEKQNILTAIDKSVETYWEDAPQRESYVMEYNLETPVEMMGVLKNYFDSDDVIRVATAAAFKNRVEVGEEGIIGSGTNNSDEDTSLPEYVYNF